MAAGLNLQDRAVLHKMQLSADEQHEKKNSLHLWGLSGPSKTIEATNTQAWGSEERWSQYKSASQWKQMAYKSNDIVKELSEHRENKKSNVWTPIFYW